ncbi:Aste57867_20782 [Aphanomyces stellatus]|uniref:Aste57867_20782 protein n=1 Tax=Aphanomyces stellatus TaxID=120398 RepID=A0A485LHV2_9STRA|nr:hypothetical protein As57867_020714 [Aphanomyces stellatus]VFT97461.1 Aste57867_20782 [Aphanomyces stellatus]
MGQVESSVATEEGRMRGRIRAVAGSYFDLEKHVDQANEWARQCSIPSTCRLRFRILLDDFTPDCLPFVWRLEDVVRIEAWKMRRSDESTIGEAKSLTVDQFYCIYCFLSDINDCAVHVLSPRLDVNPSRSPCDPDDAECQICMDTSKEVVLPCTHSFCLHCFQSWTQQNQTCPICRRPIPSCAQDQEVWQLTCYDRHDLAAHVQDLVSRVYELLDNKRH